MNRIYSLSIALIFSLIFIHSDSHSAFINMPVVNESTKSTLSFSLDSCSAWVLAGTRTDYTEFTGSSTIDSSCTELNVLGGHLYRINPSVNTHSCTVGYDGNAAMCVSSSDQCSFEADSERAIRIDINVIPGPSGTATLSGLKFYEQAPDTFVWLDGPSGPNNFPTLYGIRVLKDGVVIFQNEDIPTGQDWSLQSFSFSSIAAFTVNESTVFNFELLGYCPSGMDAPISAWDIDQIEFTSICYDDLIDAGKLEVDGLSDSITICSEDGIFDSLIFNRFDFNGSTNILVVTDETGVIDYLVDSLIIDFEGSAEGICKVWNISYDGMLEGLEPGRNINQIIGCYGISNEITINKEYPTADQILFTDSLTVRKVCVADSILLLSDFIISEGDGDQSQWIVTDSDSIIISSTDNLPVAIDLSDADECLIFSVRYNGEISGNDLGNHINTIQGCIGLSNSLIFEKDKPTPISISVDGATQISFCVSDSIISEIVISASRPITESFNYIITDSTGHIIEVLDTNIVAETMIGFDAEHFYLIVFNSLIGPILPGMNLSDIAGCFELSNVININQENTDGGVISLMGTNNDICRKAGDTTVVDVILLGNQGNLSTWVITTQNGTIINSDLSPPFDFTGFGEGIYQITHIAHENSLDGISFGDNISNISGQCLNVSNSITIQLTEVEAGSINVNGEVELNLCNDDNTSDTLFIDLIGSSGSFSQYFITDLDMNVIKIIDSGDLAIANLSPDTCLIWHMVAGKEEFLLDQGEVLNPNENCFALSNSVLVTKSVAHAGMISSNGSEFISLCQSETSRPELIINGTSCTGEFTELILTNEAGTILGYLTDTIADFSIYADGIFNVYKLVYNDTIFNNVPGNPIELISGPCFELSNNITVSLNTVEGGILNENGDQEIFICGSADNGSGININLVNEVGVNSNWLITDDSGIILEFNLSPPFDFSSFIDGDYFVWHISYASNISGMDQGQSVSEIMGCYDISNSIRINKKTVEAGNISSEGDLIVELCIQPGQTAIIPIELVGAIGDSSIWVVTDDAGTIVLIENGMPPFDFTSYDDGVYNIYHLSYSDTLSFLLQGNNLNSVQGCFSISNFVIVVKESVTPSDILYADSSLVKSVCLSQDSEVEIIQTSVGESELAGWIVTDTLGKILALPDSVPLYIEDYPSGVCLIWHINYTGIISGLTVGKNVTELSGCYVLSNSLQLHKSDAIQPVIAFPDSTSIYNVCLQDSEALIVSPIDFNPVNSESIWVLITPQGQILEIFNSVPIDLTLGQMPVCFIRKINFIDSISRLEVGNNVNELEGCLAMSNQIRIQKSNVDASEITFDNGQTSIIVCRDEGMSIFVDAIAIDPGSGDFTSWILTDSNDNILDTDISFPYQIDDQFDDGCIIRLVDYNSLSGDTIGGQVEGLEGCFALSNEIVINKLDFASSTFNSNIHFNMDSCDANILSLNNTVYSEFSGEVNLSDMCTDISVLSESLFRLNPEENIHSCTPGLNGTPALCVSSKVGCTFDPEDEKVIRLEIEVMPPEGGVSSLKRISFYERAPLMYDHIDGLSGDNNYPTLYGVRILKDSIVVFNQTDLITTQDYTLEVFDFDGVDEFVLTDTTIFSIELLAYCTAGVNSSVSAWDIEDLHIETECVYDLDGGFVLDESGQGQISLCTDDGVSDAFTLILTGGMGQLSTWIVSDDQDSILSIQQDPIFDFEGTHSGVCYIYNISYINPLTGLQTGNFLSDIMGCFDLSNAYVVEKETIASGGCNAAQTLEELQVHLAPNPIEDILNVSVKNSSAEANANISIYNGLGRLIYQAKDTKDVLSINTSNWSNGFYFIRADSGHQRTLTSFIKN